MFPSEKYPIMPTRGVCLDKFHPDSTASNRTREALAIMFLLAIAPHVRWEPTAPPAREVPVYLNVAELGALTAAIGEWRTMQGGLRTSKAYRTAHEKVRAAFSTCPEVRAAFSTCPDHPQGNHLLNMPHDGGR